MHFHSYQYGVSKKESGAPLGVLMHGVHGDRLLSDPRAPLGTLYSQQDCTNQVDTQTVHSLFGVEIKYLDPWQR